VKYEGLSSLSSLLSGVDFSARVFLDARDKMRNKLEERRKKKKKELY
jgi:hypothetical protein